MRMCMLRLCRTAVFLCFMLFIQHEASDVAELTTVKLQWLWSSCVFWGVTSSGPVQNHRTSEIQLSLSCWFVLFFLSSCAHHGRRQTGQEISPEPAGGPAAGGGRWISRRGTLSSWTHVRGGKHLLIINVIPQRALGRYTCTHVHTSWGVHFS